MTTNDNNNNNENMTITREEYQNLCNANELEPVNMIDPDAITEEIIKILKYIETPNMVALKRKNKVEFETQMMRKFDKFSSEFPFIFYKLLRGEDISPLFGMLREIKNIKIGKITFEQGEDKIVNNLLGKYVKK